MSARPSPRAVELLVEGAIVDAEGTASGYLRLHDGRVIERGSTGSDSTRGRVRRVRGIAVPPPVNSHTHLGDVGFGREPPLDSIESIIAAPGGLKFRYLTSLTARRHRQTLRAALRRLAGEGCGAVVDFREQGLDGVRRLRRAASQLPLEVRILGRPLVRPVDEGELRAILTDADGIGISSAREEDASARASIAGACRAAGRWYALHASEVVREDPDVYLEPRPDLLVHLTRATDDDLRRVQDAGVAVAVCPRSNALYGRLPDLGRLERLGVRTLLGTDNGLLNLPSIWRELEFAYVSQRLGGHPASPRFLVRSCFLDPWTWLGDAARARLQPGGPARPVVFRLPTEDPEYQLVTRATEQVMVRTGSPRSG